MGTPRDEMQGTRSNHMCGRQASTVEVDDPGQGYITLTQVSHSDGTCRERDDVNASRWCNTGFPASTLVIDP